MKLVSRMFFVLTALLLISNAAYAVNDYAPLKDVKFYLKGDYEAYGKYFSERDINKYDGNQVETNNMNVIVARQTPKIEGWLENELWLMPTIWFSDKLEFDMRLKGAKYMFQSDYNDRIFTIQNTDLGYYQAVTEKKYDYSSFTLDQAFIKFISPIGLFVVGRFDASKNGVVWAAQFPQIPKWTFAIAWNKKNEGVIGYENTWEPYWNSELIPRDYKDRDDINEIRLVTMYDSADKAFHSEQWIDFRLGDGHSVAKDMKIALPQWKAEYNKDKLHLYTHEGWGLGTLTQLTGMPTANDLADLMTNGNAIVNDLIKRPDLYSFPSQAQIPITDMGPVEGNSFMVTFVGSYDIGNFSPEIGAGYLTGASKYNEINSFNWEEVEPQGYRTPRRLQTLLIGEVEDFYYPTLATLATYKAFTTEDVALQNMTWGKIGGTYHFSDKFEIFGQAFAALRSNVRYYKQQYWDMFPIQFALTFGFGKEQFSDNAGETGVAKYIPFVFKDAKANYYEDKISKYLGTEFDLRLTYHLFDGLDVSLLGGYFMTGDFYKNVLTPKKYYLQWVKQEPDGTTKLQGNMSPIYGPNLMGNIYQKSNMWSIQWKVDFKFDTAPKRS